MVVINSPSGVIVQLSDRIDPILDYFSCPIEIFGSVEDGSLDAATTVMTHDDDMADSEFRHTVCKDGDGVEVSASVLVRDVTFGEEDTWERSEDSSFGDSGVAVWVIGRQ